MREEKDFNIKLAREIIFSVILMALIILGFIISPAHTGFFIHNSKLVENENLAKVVVNANLDIPAEYTVISEGQNIKVQITLFTLGNVEQTNVSLIYFLKSAKGAVLFEEKDSLTIYKQTSYLRTFNTRSLIPGEYIAGVEVYSKDSISSYSKIFKIESLTPVRLSPVKESFLNKYFAFTSSILTVLIIFFMAMVGKRLMQLYNKK